jgi:hypothetical protein
MEKCLPKNSAEKIQREKQAERLISGWKERDAEGDWGVVRKHSYYKIELWYKEYYWQFTAAARTAPETKFRHRE